MFIQRCSQDQQWQDQEDQDQDQDRQFKPQLVTNRKSYMGFRLKQKAMTLNDLERSKCIYSHW